MIYEGDNDLAQDVPVEVVVAKFRQSIDKNPRRVTENESVFGLRETEPIEAAMWDDMTRVNAGLEKMAVRDARITYIDVAGPMFDAKGEMLTDIYVRDKLHLNQKGYDIWSDAISQMLLTNEVQYEL